MMMKTLSVLWGIAWVFLLGLFYSCSHPDSFSRPSLAAGNQVAASKRSDGCVYVKFELVNPCTVRRDGRAEVRKPNAE